MTASEPGLRADRYSGVVTPGSCSTHVFRLEVKSWNDRFKINLQKAMGLAKTQACIEAMRIGEFGAMQSIAALGHPTNITFCAVSMRWEKQPLLGEGPMGTPPGTVAPLGTVATLGMYYRRHVTSTEHAITSTSTVIPGLHEADPDSDPDSGVGGAGASAADVKPAGAGAGAGADGDAASSGKDDLVLVQNIISQLYMQNPSKSEWREDELRVILTQSQKAFLATYPMSVVMNIKNEEGKVQSSRVHVVLRASDRESRCIGSNVPPENSALAPPGSTVLFSDSIEAATIRGQCSHGNLTPYLVMARAYEPDSPDPRAKLKNMNRAVVFSVKKPGAVPTQKSDIHSIPGDVLEDLFRDRWLQFLGTFFGMQFSERVQFKDVYSNVTNLEFEDGKDPPLVLTPESTVVQVQFDTWRNDSGVLCTPPMGRIMATKFLLHVIKMDHMYGLRSSLDTHMLMVNLVQEAAEVPFGGRGSKSDPSLLSTPTVGRAGTGSSGAGTGTGTGTGSGSRSSDVHDPRAAREPVLGTILVEFTVGFTTSVGIGSPGMLPALSNVGLRLTMPPQPPVVGRPK